MVDNKHLLGKSRVEPTGKDGGKNDGKDGRAIRIYQIRGKENREKMTEKTVGNMHLLGKGIDPRRKRWWEK